MKNRILYKAVAVILLASSLSSCIKDDVVLVDPDKYTRPINFAGPIANIQFGAKDLLEKIDTSSYFQVDETGLLHFSYDTALSTVLTDLIQFDNLTLEGSYNLGSSLKASLKTITFHDSIITNSNSNQRFDSMLIKSSNMTLSIASPAGFEGSYTIKFPDIIDSNGDTVTVNGILDPNAPVQNKDLTNAKVEFQNQANKSYCRIDITVAIDAFPFPPSINSVFSYRMVLDPFEPQVVFGYFGEMEVFKETQEIQLDFFKTLNISDIIQFRDIRLDVIINNYLGATLEVVFDSLLFTNETSGEEKNVKYNDGSDSLRVNSAVFGNPVIPSSDTLSFNADNSNLVEAINLGPTKIYTSLTGSINPDGETTPNFVTSDLKIDGSIGIDIPFWFKTEDYVRTDTIGFDLLNQLDSVQIDYLDELNLYFDFTNWFPFNIVAQAYFVDSNNVVIDSLFNKTGGELIWESGLIDKDVTHGTYGKVISPSVTNPIVHMGHDKAKKLYDNHAAFIHLSSHVSTGDIENPEFVKLYDTYTMDIKLSVEIKSGSIQ